jgi:putative endonuclease
MTGVREEAGTLKGGWVYILASRYRGTLYIGVTSNIAARSWQHREGSGSDFAKRYEVRRLVYTEEYPTIAEAIAREKALKKWRRDWKIELVEAANPEWDNLFDRING